MRLKTDRLEGLNPIGCQIEKGVYYYVQDDYCDDENNNPGCLYDGGDCCGDLEDIQLFFCVECECIHQDFL